VRPVLLANDDLGVALRLFRDSSAGDARRGPAAEGRALPAPQGSNEQGLALTLPRRSCPAVLMEIEPAGQIPPRSSGPGRPNGWA